MGNQKKWMQAVVLITLSFFNIAAHAQPINPWLADGLNRQIQQNRNNAQGSNQGPSAAEVRAWEQREAKIQAQIAKHRATPYWMAIGLDIDAGLIYANGGYSSEQKAINKVLARCKSSNCQILKTFNNTCAVIVAATASAKNVENFFIAVDKDDNKAAAQAMQACVAVHGKRSDKCFYSSTDSKHGSAFCTGYDYSVYGY